MRTGQSGVEIRHERRRCAVADAFQTCARSAFARQGQHAAVQIWQNNSQFAQIISPLSCSRVTGLRAQVFTEVGAAHSGSSSDDAGLDSIAAMKKVSVVVAVVAMLLLTFVFFW